MRAFDGICTSTMQHAQCVNQQISENIEWLADINSIAPVPPDPTYDQTPFCVPYLYLTMGKGSNVQKAQAARERNQKKLGKSDEERKAARAKSAADSAAFVCKICRQTFMSNARPPVLYLHVTSHHAGTDPVACFDQLVGFDPDDPKGLKKTCTPAGPVKPKKSKKKEENLEDMLSAGLTMGKKTKKKPGKS